MVAIRKLLTVKLILANCCYIPAHCSAPPILGWVQTPELSCADPADVPDPADPADLADPANLRGFGRALRTLSVTRNVICSLGFS